MNERSTAFEKACEIAFDEEHWQKINYNTGCYERNYAKSMDNYKKLDLERRRAYIIRNKSIQNLEKLLVEFETNFCNNGGTVLWARDAADARQQILEIVNAAGTDAVVRSNSSVLDEINLNEVLESNNVKVVETSVARFVLQAAGMKSYHPVSPAIHLSKEEINGILTDKYKLKSDSTAKQMVNFIRHQVSDTITKTSVCITGANFLLSDIGGVALTENEGNILKMSAESKVHIVVAGINKVTASVEDLSVLLPLLSSHATGQNMAAFNTITYGPAKNKKEAGSMYVILLNNGRSNLLSDEKQRKIMSCIRCGACINVCPVYKNIGGYSYGTEEVGPLGVIATPLKEGQKEYEHLATACSLCRRCTEICPVKIPLDDLIVQNRHLLVEATTKDDKINSVYKMIVWHCKVRKRLDSPLWLKRIEIKKLLSRMPEQNVFPDFAQKSFSQMWKDGQIK